MLRLARMDGLVVLTIAALFAVLSAAGGDRPGALVGLLIAGAGAFELHGASLLQHLQIRGMQWLVWSQLFLMITVLGYCQYRLTHMDLELLRTAVTDDLRAQLARDGYKVDDFLTMLYRTVCVVVAVLTFVYQGSMALYYVRRQKAVQRALTAYE